MKSLRFVFPVLFLALCAGFTSCSKDDDKESTDAAAIVGTWKFSSSSVDIETNNSAMTSVLKEAMQSSIPSITSSTYVFKADGTFTMNTVANSETYSESGKYVAANGTITTTATNNEATTLTYSISGSKLTLSEDLLTAEQINQMQTAYSVKITKFSFSMIYNKQ